MKNKSLNSIAWRKFKNDKFAVVSLIFIIILIFISIFPYFFITDKSPYANEQNLSIRLHPPGTEITFIQVPRDNFKEQKLIYSLFFGFESEYKSIPISSFQKTREGISFQLYDSEEIVFYNNTNYKIIFRNYFIGTDRYGRDLLSRIILGTRVSLSIGFIAVIISLIIGVLLGSLAGYYRGRLDNIIMWLVNVIWSIPTLLMVIAITLSLGKGFWQVFIAVGFTMWVEVARVVRGQVIAEREKEYVNAAKSLVYSDFRIILRHILPNIFGPIIVISAANFASAILIESGLSFLGIGAQMPIPSWGGIIKDHYNYIFMDKAYLAIFPGLAIIFSVLSFMLLGNGLRSSLDVKN